MGSQPQRWLSFLPLVAEVADHQCSAITGAKALWPVPSPPFQSGFFLGTTSLVVNVAVCPLPPYMFVVRPICLCMCMAGEAVYLMGHSSCRSAQCAQGSTKVPAESGLLCWADLSAKYYLVP